MTPLVLCLRSRCFIAATQNLRMRRVRNSGHPQLEQCQSGLPARRVMSANASVCAQDSHECLHYGSMRIARTSAHKVGETSCVCPAPGRLRPAAGIAFWLPHRLGSCQDGTALLSHSMTS